MNSNSNKHTNSQNPQGLTKSSLRGTKQSRFNSIKPGLLRYPRNDANTKSAFTLIELLVVIAIIGILSSIVLTTFSGIRDKARIAAGQRFDSNLYHTIGDQMVGEWTFDNPSNLYYDSSNMGNNGSCTNCPSTTTGYNNKTAMSFDGVASQLNVGNSNLLLATNAITVSAWVNLSQNNFTHDQVIISKGSHSVDTASSVFALTYGWGNDLYFRIRATDGTAFGTPVLIVSRGVWHNIVGTYDGVTDKLYVDGVLMTTASYTKTINTSNSSIVTIGVDSGGAFLNGYIDDVRLYTSALSSSNIQKLYAEGKASHEVATK